MKNNEWRQVGGNQFEEEVVELPGRHIWVSDGVMGYSRPLAEGETAEEAGADFELRGETVEEYRLYQDGERVE